MLKDVSQIKISGGCEVFAEGCITFIPMGKDNTMVQVDNSGQYFYDETSTPIASFEVKVYTEQLSNHIENWVGLMGSVQKKPDYFSTRNAVVLFDFSLQNGKVHFSYAENQGGYQLDPLIESIEAFVATCHEKVNPQASISSKALFTAKNRTEKFLGNPDEREKAVFQFNDMNGLHGGRVIVVTGTGNALVQIISFNNEQNKMWEKRYSFNISPVQLSDIFTEIINIDVLMIQLEDRPGIPDETRIHFSMTNANNDFFKLETWEHSSLPPDAYPNTPRAKFDKACLLLKRLEHIARTEKTPVQQGPYVHP
ncbi:MAG: hypothetical protein SWH54_11190 [Thermodesulfobacteriota bacterium]|nr:hypothetical protein [Thermodesulfobacteriota bacterium]